MRLSLRELRDVAGTRVLSWRLLWRARTIDEADELLGCAAPANDMLSSKPWTLVSITAPYTISGGLNGSCRPAATIKHMLNKQHAMNNQTFSELDGFGTGSET